MNLMNAAYEVLHVKHMCLLNRNTIKQNNYGKALTVEQYSLWSPLAKKSEYQYQCLISIVLFAQGFTNFCIGQCAKGG